MSDVFKFKVSKPHLVLRKFQRYTGGEIIEVNLDLPEEEIDRSKQYDKKCKVIFKNSEGVMSYTYLKYHLSGWERKE